MSEIFEKLTEKLIFLLFFDHRFYMAEVTAAILYLHGKNIAYR